MRKVKIKYESHIFQDEYIDHYKEEVVGDLKKNENEVILNCFLSSSTDKEKTTFIFKEDEICIKRVNYTLLLKKDENVEFETKTEYGSIMFVTRLKKYLILANKYVVNYELLIGNESAGSYVLKISYEEVKEND